MKKLLTILLLFIYGVSFSQIPGKSRVITFPYSANGFTTQAIAVRVPGDSAPGTPHWALFTSEGAGQVDGTNVAAFTYATKSTGEYAASTNATFRFYDKKKGRYESGYIISIKNNQSNPLTTARLMACVAYMKAHYPDMDTTQLYYNALSLTGGEATALAGDTVNGKIFAAVGGMSPTQDSLSVAMMKGIQVNHLPTWFMDYNDDSNGPTGGNLQNMIFYCPNGAYAGIVPNPRYYIPTPSNGGTTNHAGGWVTGMDTLLGGRTLLVDSGNFSGHSGHTNQSIVVDSSFYEWMLNYERPAVVVTGPPSCTTNSSPTNGSTVPYGIIAFVTWAYAPTSTSYNLYYWTGSTPPSTPNVTGITSTSYTIKGLTGSTTYHWYIAPVNSFGESTGCSSSATTFVTNSPGLIDSLSDIPVIIDLSGASSNDPNKVLNTVDGYRLIDPLFGVTGDTTSTLNPKHGLNKHNGFPMYAFGAYFPVGRSGTNTTDDSTNYPGKRNMRVYWSFSNYYNKKDTTRQFKLRHLFWYEPAGTPSGLVDSLINCDSCMLRQTAHDSIEWRLARPDSLCKAFDYLVTTGVEGWHDKIITATAMRHLLMCVSRTSGVSFNASQFAFYGQYNTALDTSKVQKQWSLPLFQYVFGDTMHTMYRMNGMNGVKGVNSRQSSIYGAWRFFIGLGDKHPGNYFLDDSSHQGLTGDVNFWFAHTSDFTVNYFRQLKNNYGIHSIVTLSSTSGYDIKHGWGIINIDHPNVDEPERASSYTMNARMSYLLGSKTGPNVISSSLTLDWNGTDAGYANGLNLGIAYSFGNEFRSHYKTNGVVFAEKSGEFDGDEGRLGAGYGKQSADSTTILTDEPNATVSLDDVKSEDFYAWFLRTDHRIPQDAFDVHQYQTDKDSSGTTLTYTQQIRAHAVSPERAYAKIGMNFLTFHQKANRDLLTYAMGGRTKKPLIIKTEGGFGQDSILSKTDSAKLADGVTNQPQYNTSINHDQYTIIPIPGLTADQTRSVYAQRIEWIIGFTGYDCQYVYTFENSSGSTISSAQFGSMGETCCSSISSTDSFAIGTVYADYYVHGSNIVKAKNVEPELIIYGLDSIGLNLFHYRGALSIDSIAYPFWLGSISGATQFVDIDMPLGVTSYIVVTPSYNSLTPTVTSGTVVAGKAHVLATEMPQVIYAKESSASIILGDKGKLLHKRSVKKH